MHCTMFTWYPMSNRHLLIAFPLFSHSNYPLSQCMWKEVLSQQRIRQFKILQSMYFAYDVGIISS